MSRFLSKVDLTLEEAIHICQAAEEQKYKEKPEIPRMLICMYHCKREFPQNQTGQVQQHGKLRKQWQQCGSPHEY